MSRIKFAFLCVFFLLRVFTGKAQVDPHFTQFYAFPIWLNPAMSGVINGGDCRLVAIHRNQWNKITSPYSTFGLSYDWLTKQTWGMGIQAVHQSAGDGGYQNTTVAFSICNNNLAFGADQEHHLSLALQIGLNNRSIQPAKFQYGDQYNPVIGYDPSIATRANNWISRQSIFQPDAGAGIFYYFSKYAVL
jgi:type IX secretion system PorP/SprF family membrane protein